MSTTTILWLNCFSCLAIWTHFHAFIATNPDEPTILPPICEPQFHKCYTIVDTKLTWTETEFICLTLDGHLTSIASAAENAFVHASILAHAAADSGDYWIGANNANTNESNYAWSGHTPFDYTHWADGFPNENAENCVAVYTQPEQLTTRWYNDGCSNSAKIGVCESPLKNVTIDITDGSGDN